MKKTQLALLISCLAALLVLSHSYSLRSNHVRPPGGGYANDPVGQRTCNQCHSGNPIADGSKFSYSFHKDSIVRVGSDLLDTSTTYLPDSTYFFSIKMVGMNGVTPRYGFQLTALDSLNAKAGTFIVTNASRNSLLTTRGIGYIGHANADGDSVWYFKWTAPHAAAGRVTFYATGMIADYNGQNTGDLVYTHTVSIRSRVATSTANIQDIATTINLYPIPTGQLLHASLVLHEHTELKLSLLGMDGREIRNLYSGTANEGAFDQTFDVADLSVGLYLIKVECRGQSVIKAIVKE